MAYFIRNMTKHKNMLTAGILLAAGRSKRMRQPKLLIPLMNKPLILHSLTPLLKSNLQHVILVLGTHHKDILQLLPVSLKLTVVVNQSCEEGMSSSIKSAIPYLYERTKAIMIALADNPSLSETIINKLLEEADKTTKNIIAPQKQGKMGHPVIFKKKYFPSISQLKGDEGGKLIIEQNPEDLLLIEIDSDAIFTDIDTPEDLKTFTWFSSCDLFKPPKEKMEAMELQHLFLNIHERLLQGELVASATIVAVKGSTPRDVGAKMLIFSNGQTFGTVGGGCGEAEVLRKARWAIHEEKPTNIKVDLTEDPVVDNLKICGGIMYIFIDIWSKEDLPITSTILDYAKQEKEVALATILESGKKLLTDGKSILAKTIKDCGADEVIASTAQIMLASEKISLEKITFQNNNTMEVFFETIVSSPILIIVGAGHIAQPLVTFGKLLGFKVAVIDDRPEYANNERFPNADIVEVLELSNNLKLNITRKTYLVLVTRGHRYDEDVLRQTLDSPAAYIGMIGSRRRIKAIFKDLLEEGYRKEQLDKVYAPIGLDIGAQTPSEIALAIMAEIVNIRRGGKAQSLKNQKINNQSLKVW